MELLFKYVSLEQITHFGTQVIGALVLLLVGWIVAGWMGTRTARVLTKAKVDETLTRFFGTLTKYLVIVLVILACLSLFGVQMTSFAAILAAAGFAIGLAFQGTLSNFSAGVMLLTFRPFKIGDVVNTAGIVGKVVEIELFTTVLDTPDNRRIVIPNSSIFGSTIENITYHDTRRVDVNVGTDYSANLDRTREVLEQVANSDPAKLPDMDSQVYLLELGDSSINWVIRVWTKTADYWSARERITYNTKVALDEAGIGIPFPQMDVHLDGSAPSQS
jgi:small conductance mechanosensitive channel